MWVHPKAFFFFFFFSVMGYFYWPLTKKSRCFSSPQILTSCTNMGLQRCYSKENFEWTFCRTSLLNKTFSFNFGLSFCKRLRFILINLISCDTSKAEMFWFFYFLQWAIWLANHQKQYDILLPQVKIIFFTLFYIASYINVFVLHLHCFTCLCKII